MSATASEPVPGPRVSQKTASLLTVTSWLRRARRLEALVAACAVFHAGMAVTLLFAPEDQLVTEATRPALMLMSRYAWAAAFALASLLVGLLLWERFRRVRPIAWILAFAIGGGGWLSSLILATLQGHGAATAAWVWAFLYALWAVTAVLHSLDRR